MAIETIYDHAATDEELTSLLGDAVSKNAYQRILGDANTEFGMIFRLYMTRGDKKKADAYLQKITDEEYKRDLRSHDTPLPE